MNLNEPRFGKLRMRFKYQKFQRFLIGFLGGITLCALCVFTLYVDDLASHNVDQMQILNSRELDGSGQGLGRGLRIDNRPELVKIKGDDKVALQLAKKVNVVCCLYFKNPLRYFNNYNSTMDTWGKKCTKILFFVDYYNESLTTSISFEKVKQIVLPSTSYLIIMYRYLYQYHFKDGDWFFLAEAVPFVVMENLRHFLSLKDPYVSVYYGHKLKLREHEPGVIFPDRSAGIVLSKEGLRLLGEKGASIPVCNNHDYFLGVQLALCMKDLGITFGDTRDGENKSRFLTFPLGMSIKEDTITFDYFEDMEVTGIKGIQKLSKSMITVGRSNFFCYGYDFLVYHQLIVDM